WSGAVDFVRRSAQRFGEERSVAWSLLVGAGGFLTLVFARSFWHVLVGVVLISVAISFVRPLVTAMVSKRTRLEQGVTMGIQTAFDALGRSLGPLWSGAVYLWRDWAPFATSVVVYLLFYGLIQTAWRRVDGMPEPSRGAP
ncbi:MAG TPA: MFS transporter, partial [Symbiobacteriaceae bacterium]|nr:MFS transporter [Symbiobacteriaceae bacterium]